MKKTGRFGMRVQPEDKERWERAAQAHGLPLSAWITIQLNGEALKTELGLRAATMPLVPTPFKWDNMGRRVPI